MDRVGVRELRQNLSVYLRRIGDGETLEVTERGRPVALLTPLPGAPTGALARLAAQGRIVRMARGERRELPPPMPSGAGSSLSELVDESRDDRL